MNELSWKKKLFKNTKSQALCGTVGETCQNVRLTNWTSFKRFEGQLMKTREVGQEIGFCWIDSLICIWFTWQQTFVPGNYWEAEL